MQIDLRTWIITNRRGREVDFSAENPKERVQRHILFSEDMYHYSHYTHTFNWLCWHIHDITHPSLKTLAAAVQRRKNETR